MPAVSASADNPIKPRSSTMTIVLAWLVPGLGHFTLGRRGRAALIFCTVAASFAVGLLMRGPMFQVSSNGDLLSRLIQYGGFIADLSSGLFYFLTVWFGYAAPEQAGHNPDYGSKFLVAAGLLNILAIVDAYEINNGQKE